MDKYIDFRIGENSKMNKFSGISDKAGITGYIEMIEFDLLPSEDGITPAKDAEGNYIRVGEGKVVGRYNVILNQTRTALTKCISSATPAPVVQTMRIGDDVGEGTIMEPQEATENLTEIDQTIVYSVPEEEFSVSYPSDRQVTFFATVNGASVMAEYPNSPNVIYTSAVLLTTTGKAFSYKRFPARTISPLISVDISWTITFN